MELFIMQSYVAIIIVEINELDILYWIDIENSLTITIRSTSIGSLYLETFVANHYLYIDTYK